VGTDREAGEGNTEREFLHGVPVRGELGRIPVGLPAVNPSNRVIARSGDVPSCTYNFAFSRIGSAIRVYL
jgi:hypothetical protein